MKKNFGYSPPHPAATLSLVFFATSGLARLDDLPSEVTNDQHRLWVTVDKFWNEEGAEFRYSAYPNTPRRNTHSGPQA